MTCETLLAGDADLRGMRRVVEDGVVVWRRPETLGYPSFETKDGTFDGYAAFSITDPGNAGGRDHGGGDHRFWPHTYGVSFLFQPRTHGRRPLETRTW